MRKDVHQHPIVLLFLLAHCAPRTTDTMSAASSCVEVSLPIRCPRSDSPPPCLGSVICWRFWAAQKYRFDGGQTGDFAQFTSGQKTAECNPGVSRSQSGRQVSPAFSGSLGRNGRSLDEKLIGSQYPGTIGLRVEANLRDRLRWCGLEV